MEKLGAFPLLRRPRVPAESVALEPRKTLGYLTRNQEFESISLQRGVGCGPFPSSPSGRSVEGVQVRMQDSGCRFHPDSSPRTHFSTVEAGTESLQTPRWRKPDSNRRYRVTQARFREGLMSLPLTEKSARTRTDTRTTTGAFRGTDYSNPLPSSGESANYRFLSVRAAPAVCPIYEVRGPPSTLSKRYTLANPSLAPRRPTSRLQGANPDVIAELLTGKGP
jgi:hypothetical protein